MNGDGSFSTTYGSINEHDETYVIRRKLKYFFMNPCDKYKAKRKIPWKLSLQILKIFVVTTQIIIFGLDRSVHTEFLDRTNIAFKHLYLKDWNPSYETMPYPPATGPFAIYTIPDFYDSVNFILEQYNKTNEIAIGTYSKKHNASQVRLCRKRYTEISLYPNSSYDADINIVTNCTELHAVNSSDGTTKWDTASDLKTQHFPMKFDRIIGVWVEFKLETLHLKTVSKTRPTCYNFLVQVVFDNEAHDGQLLINLKSLPEPYSCSGSFDATDASLATNGIQTLNFVIILMSALSLVLCLRSLVLGQKLRKETTVFFKSHYGEDLTTYDKMEFLSFWYIMIIINDAFVIIGSALMIQIIWSTSTNYEACGVFLGTGNLLVWFGLLRYLKFFETYNILILTLQKAFPQVLRFLVCASALYVGFLICGWVVLGPYHIKFRYLSTASECMFSLINGDDMFVTFQAIPYSNSYIWWYSRVYLYVFVALFIYVALNLFISIIIDVYETIKEYYRHGFPKSSLQKFIEFLPEDQAIFDNRSWGTVNCGGATDVPCFIAPCYALCCKRSVEPDSDEYQRLVRTPPPSPVV